MSEIKFGYFNRKDYLTIEFSEFTKENFNKRGGNKFLQLYVLEKPLILAGNDMYHKDIFAEGLHKLCLEFSAILNPESTAEIPSPKGELYELVGAGYLDLVKNKLLFDENSSDYKEVITGTNKKHLIEFFGEKNVEEKNLGGEPYFLVNLNKIK